MVVSLDVPHATADLPHNVVVLRVADGQKWSGLAGSGRTGLGSTIVRSTLSRSLSTALLKLLTSTRAIGSWNGLVSTSTVGCQMGIVDSRDWLILEMEVGELVRKLTERNWGSGAHVLV